METTGTSPRMWGTVLYSVCSLCCLRYIPTHVGNRVVMPVVSAIIAVHPHACGEQAAFATFGCTRYGTSPRMWGTGLIKIVEIIKRRYIPTHVGNRVFAAIAIPPVTVHPHACGEQSF